MPMKKKKTPKENLPGKKNPKNNKIEGKKQRKG